MKHLSRHQSYKVRGFLAGPMATNTKVIGEIKKCTAKGFIPGPMETDTKAIGEIAKCTATQPPERNNESPLVTVILWQPTWIISILMWHIQFITQTPQTV